MKIAPIVLLIVASCYSTFSQGNQLNYLASALQQIAQVKPISIQKKLEKTLANAGINLGVSVGESQAQELIKIVETARFFGEEFQDKRFEDFKRELFRLCFRNEDFNILNVLDRDNFIKAFLSLSGDNLEFFTYTIIKILLFLSEETIKNFADNFAAGIFFNDEKEFDVVRINSFLSNENADVSIENENKESL